MPRNAPQPSSASTSYEQNYNSQNFQGPARRDWQPFVRGLEGEEAEVGEAEARAEYRKEILLSRRIQDVHCTEGCPVEKHAKLCETTTGCNSSQKSRKYSEFWRKKY